MKHIASASSSLFATLASVALVASLSACPPVTPSEGEGEGGEGEGEVVANPLPQPYEGLVEAIGGAATRCGFGGPDPFSAQVVALIDPTVHVEGIEGLEREGIRKILANPNIHHDDAQAALCATAFASLSCEAFQSSSGVPASCQLTFKGTLAAGGTCHSSQECASNNCNSNGNNAGCGICAAAFACNSNNDCAGNTPVCRNGGTDQAVCVALSDVGGDCNQTSECAANLRCSNNGTCITPAQSGDACGQGDCLEPLVCGANNTCTDPVALNGACAQDTDCAAGLHCPGTTSTCTASAHVGAACDPQDGLSCDANLSCGPLTGGNFCIAQGTKVGDDCNVNSSTPCGFSLQSGLFCAANTAKCAAIVIVDNGPCDSETHICKFSFSTRGCNQNLDAPVCADLNAVGAACTSGLGCVSTSGTTTPNAQCNFGAANPICVAVPGIGGTCSESVQCDSGLECSDQNVCFDPNTAVCPTVG